MTGYYFDKSHTASTLALKEDEMVARIIKDLTEGWEDTGAKCGVIGEVGCSYPLTGNMSHTVKYVLIENLDWRILCNI